MGEKTPGSAQAHAARGHCVSSSPSALHLVHASFRTWASCPPQCAMSWCPSSQAHITQMRFTLMRSNLMTASRLRGHHLWTLRRTQSSRTAYRCVPCESYTSGPARGRSGACWLASSGCQRTYSKGSGGLCMRERGTSNTAKFRLTSRANCVVAVLGRPQTFERQIDLTCSAGD